MGRRAKWRRFAAAVVCWFAAGICSAQVNLEQGQSKPTAEPIAPPRGEFAASVRVPLIDQPLRLADFRGMEPREDLRGRLGHVARFTQNQPSDGQPATEKTEVWMGRTQKAVYFVFVCWDRHADLIRSHMQPRENILKDDYVTVLLDPFQDRRIGVLFQVNPAGVQADAAYAEATGSDYSYDQVWDSDGRVTGEGWVALIAIPFRSLRFRPSASEWGVVFSRNFPRNSEVDDWPRVSTSRTGTLTQEGTLLGMEDGTGSHNVQINPYVLGQNLHALNTLDPLNPYFTTRHAEATAGGEAKAIWHDALVFDGTVNPDFSDVESDQPQFTVNQRYPVYFPELRPFFLENASYFSTPLTLLYTRNILRPQVGGRVTGKLGHTNLGLLAVDDRSPGRSVPGGDPEREKKAGFFAGRVSEDLGKNSSAGVMYTDEEFAGGFNRIGALDSTVQMGSNWKLMAQIAESATHPGRSDSASREFPRQYRAGPASDVQLQRSGHAFSMFNEYTDVSSGFRTTMGFLQSSDIRSDHNHATYRWYSKSGTVQSYGVESDQQIAFDHSGNRLYRYTQLDPFLLLSRNTVLAPVALFNSDTLGPQNGYPMARSVNFAENGLVLVARGQPWSQFNFNVNAGRVATVNYNPAPGKPPVRLRQDTAQVLFTLQPLRGFTADQTYLLDRDFNPGNNAFVYESQVLRTKLNYQFTRSLSARVIVEYDSTLVNPAETSLQRTKQVQTQALFTWLPHPGTAIYVGWNNDLQNLEHSLCTRLGGMCDVDQPILPRGRGYLNDGRQFFVKASYLLRF